MILITSVSPTHKNKEIQQKAVETWIKAGFTPYTINHTSENVPLYEGLNYVKTEKEYKDIYGKTYLPIDAIFEFMRNSDQENFCICNSDIWFGDMTIYSAIERKMQNNVLIGHRVDYDETPETGRLYLGGMDTFFINKKYLNLFPESKFVLGQCHWDFWIPYKCATNGVNVLFLHNREFYHKKHDLQYDNKSWINTANLLIEQEGLTKFKGKHGHATRFVYDRFKRQSKNVVL